MMDDWVKRGPGLPQPQPTANEAVHRLDAEAEAYRAKHAAGIIAAWVDREDIETYNSWDEAAVRQHWPELWTRWRNLVQARERFVAMLDNEQKRRKVVP